MRAIRGATQVPGNSESEIAASVQELLGALMAANSLKIEDIISVILTSTPDLNAAFPASGAREIGFEATPLLGAVELDVPGALKRVIRVMVHCETELSISEITHIYLHGAISLRRDIAQ